MKKMRQFLLLAVLIPLFLGTCSNPHNSSSIDGETATIVSVSLSNADFKLSTLLTITAGCFATTLFSTWYITNPTLPVIDGVLQP